jgi:hypothetical protein
MAQNKLNIKVEAEVMVVLNGVQRQRCACLGGQ